MSAIRNREAGIADLEARIGRAKTDIPKDITVDRQQFDRHLADLSSLLNGVGDLTRTMLTKLEFRAVLAPREGKTAGCVLLWRKWDR